MDKGYILLSRGLLDSPVFASQMMLKIWIWCLCKANFKDRHVPLKVGKGEIIVSLKRGSFLFGRHKAEEELFIDGSTIYKAIKKIEDLGMISIVSNNQYSVITICKYNDYQDNENYKVASNEQVKDKQSTTEQQPRNTTNTLSNVNTLTKVTNDVVDVSYEDSKNLPTTQKIDYDQLILFFNQRRGSMPEVKIISDARKKRLKSILNTHSKEDLKKVILICEKLDFMQGRNYKGWVANFDWITNPANFIKILEGNYNNNTSTNGKSESKQTEPLFGRQTAATVRANLSGWENLE